MTTPLTLVIGCTGSGKGALGRALASRTGGEIISLDSMKVYRRMDIGTAKPPAEVRRRIPHHLIDVAEPQEDFSVARYVEAADDAVRDIRARARPVFVVGGTPLFMKALLDGLFEGPGADARVRERLSQEAASSGTSALHERLARVDPSAAERIHRNDLRRIIRALEVHELTGRPISSFQVQWDRQRRYDAQIIGLRRERDDQNRRTNERVRRMLDAGLLDEVRALLAEPEPLGTTARQAVGYAELIEHLEGRVGLAGAVEMVKINTRQLAKSQRTWFKRFAGVEWIDLAADDSVEHVAGRLVKRFEAQWSPSPK